MGTSLSGLTPATTFDGLLKVGDNDPLTADLKAISTGDGTDTILQLSNSALQVNGDLNVGTVHKIYQDNTNLNIIGNSGSTALKYFTNFGQNNTNQFGLNNFFRYQVGIGFTSTQSSAMLNVKGSGTTSATTSLLVQNSVGTELFKVQDDGIVSFTNLEINGTTISRAVSQSISINSLENIHVNRDAHIFRTSDGGAYSEAMRITGFPNQFVGIGETTPTARLHVKGSGNDNTTTSLLVQNSDASASLTYDDSGKVEIVGNAQTGFIQTYGFGAVGFGNESGPTIIYGDNLAGLHTSSGYTAFGANSSSSQRVLIKGSGTTSATTSLLVQNSAGTSILSVRDDGYTNIGVGQNIAIANYNDIFIKAGGTYFRDMSNNYHAAITENGAQFGLGYTGPDTGVRLQVKGSGNDATTTALLVENSDGDDLFSVRDDGKVNIDNDVYIQGAIYGGSNTKLRVGTNLNVASTRAWIQGLGTTSATKALLVQKSDGVSILTLKDNGDFTVGGSSDLGIISGGRSRFRFGLLVGDTSSSETSAVLEAKSTTQGFLPPRMTDAERDAIATPAAGLMIYDTANNQMNYWNGSTWIAF